VLPIGKKAREAESLSSQRLCDAQNLNGKPKTGRSVGVDPRSSENREERPRPRKTVSCCAVWTSFSVIWNQENNIFR
jgi:hypothetical protein